MEDKDFDVRGFKLYNFIEDLNADLYEKDSIFEEYPLVFSTTGFASAIDFCDTRICFSEETSDWKDVLGEVYKISEAWRVLHSTMTEFFRKRLNDELEEKYGLGVEKDEG